jgi:hypothetical protein
MKGSGKMKNGSDKTRQQEADRRGFLKMVGIGGVVGSVAAATGVAPSEAAEAKPENGSGYRETEHVRRYYELARF